MDKGTYTYDPMAHPHWQQVAGLGSPIGAGFGAAPTFAQPSQQDIDREMYAMAISVLVAQWNKEIDKVLNGSLSLTSVVNRGLIFVPRAWDARQTMLRAKKELNEKFMPLALNAVRDRSRFLKDAKESVRGYIDQLNQQYHLSLKIVDEQAFVPAMKQAADDMTNPKKWEWWQWGLVVVGAAYVVNAFKF
jgi:hypothetical protein